MSNIPPPPTDAETNRQSTASRLHFSLDGYDSVVGITENAVNSALASTWEPSRIKLQLLKADEEIEDKTYVSAEVEGQVLAPTVEFLVDSFKGIFYMHFGDDATFKLQVISGGVPTLKPYSISDWTLAWEVDFSREKIDKLPEAQRRIVQNLRDYTPHHVFVNFSNANLLHPIEEKSNTPTPASLDPTKESDPKKRAILEKRVKEIRDTLPLLTSDWIRQQADAGKNVFGYDITATNLDSSIVSSLQATDLSMQNYPYWTKGKVNSDGSTLYHPWSCFLFANQFANRKMPSNNAGTIRPIAYSGNLATPFGDNNQTAGSLVIRNDCFMDNLTNVLKTISDDMFLSPEKVTFKSESILRDCRQDFEVKRGTRKCMVNFQKSQSRNSNATTTVKWDQPMYEMKIEGADFKGKDGALGKVEGNLTTRGANVVTVTGGENFIRVKGWSDYRFTWHAKIGATWWNQNGWPWVDCGWDWEFLIRLGLSPEGKIQLRVDDADFKVTTRPLQLVGTIGYYMDDIKSIKGLDSPVTASRAKDALNPINDALKTAGIFVLPAAGQYNFYNPVFTAAGDLMVSLKLELTQNRINGAK